MADGSSAPSVRTTCPYCGVGCGLQAIAGGGRALMVSGDNRHPANAGRICSKGAALGSTVGLDGRLLHPMIGERRVRWDRATRLVARRFNESIDRHGPDSVAFYVSGQLLTEDYYLANKLMKGFIGSANIDTNSRLCMASAVAAHKQAFGQDLVPGCYEDLDLADLVVFAGHNAAWTHPVLYRRAEAARERGQRHVVIDPRRTETAAAADLHLPIAPQSDVRLWNGLLADLDRRGALDPGFIADHVAGWSDVRRALQSQDQSRTAVAADCGVEPGLIDRFFDLFAALPRTVSLFSMGVNQSAHGVDKALSILNVHLATGRIGKPGACPFSITGQPNAMGGREVGAMANTLAAHMDFDAASRSRLARFWSAPSVAARPGLKAVELFEAMGQGRIKAVWIMATNPAVSLPASARVRAALARCPFVVVSDCMAKTDTSRFAHVRLPALAWGEKDGTVTNSERCISRQRRLLPPPGEARPDWRIISDVGAAMGFGEAFAFRTPVEVFREWARLTAFENQSRLLNLEPLVGLTPEAYERLEPVQWPMRPGGERLFTNGRFPTPHGLARMTPVAAAGPAHPVDGAFGLSLNTGRLRDQWHTMTRTGLAPELCRHAPEPALEIHPEDAAAAGVRDGGLVRLRTGVGEAVVLARCSQDQRRGSVFLPMHFTDAFASSGRANVLIEPMVDPISGQPEFKHTPARVRPYGETWRGFLLAREPADCPPGLDLVWRRTPQGACQLHEFAGRGDDAERQALRRAVMGRGEEALVLEDEASGLLREAWLSGGRLERVLAISVSGRLPPRDWLAGQFESERLGAAARVALLHGRPLTGWEPAGPAVCACMNVAAAAIEAAIGAGASNADQIARVTGAGSNCGACRPEVSRMIARHTAREAMDA